MAIVPRLFPKIQKEKKPSYVRYIQKRNFLISLISISLFIGICLILFTILCMVLLKRQLIRDKEGNPYKEAWFLWPIWIFYCISMAIAINQVHVRYREFATLRLEVFPPTQKASNRSASSSSSGVDANSSETTSNDNNNNNSNVNNNNNDKTENDDAIVTVNNNNNNSSIDGSAAPLATHYREEIDDDDVHMMMGSKKERKQQRVPLNAVWANEWKKKKKKWGRNGPLTSSEGVT